MITTNFFYRLDAGFNPCFDEEKNAEKLELDTVLQLI
jgi:hypothetical protein